MLSLLRSAIVGLLAGPVFAQPAGAVMAQSEPERVIASLYDAIVAHHGPDWVNAKRRGPPLSRALVALWAKTDAKAKRDKDELGPVDFDVATNSQGAELKSYTLTTVSADPARAVVAVTVVPDNWLRGSPAENDLAFDLAFDGKTWAIDDIRGVAGKTKWSLRAMLTDYLAQK